MILKWIEKWFGKSDVSCRLHFNRRSQRRLLWKRAVLRS